MVDSVHSFLGTEQIASQYWKGVFKIIQRNMTLHRKIFKKKKDSVVFIVASILNIRRTVSAR